MKGMHRVALLLGLVLVSATSVEAADIQGPEGDAVTALYVANNFLADVRVFAEDADGKLHHLGRVSRGDLGMFDVPEELTGSEFRIKVYPTTPVWSPVSDMYGVRTNTLVAARDREVRLWIEADLERSIVEIARG